MVALGRVHRDVLQRRGAREDLPRDEEPALVVGDAPLGEHAPQAQRRLAGVVQVAVEGVADAVADGELQLLLGAQQP
ncbi:MAG: hypothetical protein IPF99_17790 [Deltaproteobacteria bacterium]|nr:hypothetical protein [Deltaproteobacteria bacterium]